MPTMSVLSTRAVMSSSVYLEKETPALFGEENTEETQMSQFSHWDLNAPYIFWICGRLEGDISQNPMWACKVTCAYHAIGPCAFKLL